MRHNHHIIPRHAGGTNDPDNLISLTVEEHAQAHKELYEEFGRDEDRRAWLGLSGIIGKEEIVWEINRENGKRAGAVALSKGSDYFRDIQKLSPGFKGKAHSEETKAQMSASHSNKECPHCGHIGNSPNVYRYHFTNCKNKE